MKNFYRIFLVFLLITLFIKTDGIPQSQCTNYRVMGAFEVCPNQNVIYQVQGGNVTSGGINWVSGGYQSFNATSIRWGSTPGEYQVEFSLNCGYVTRTVKILSPTTSSGGTIESKEICYGETGVTLHLSYEVGQTISGWEKRVGGVVTQLNFKSSPLPSEFIDNTQNADYRAILNSYCGGVGYSNWATVSIKPFQYFFLSGGKELCPGEVTRLYLNGSEPYVQYLLQKDGFDYRSPSNTPSWDLISEPGHYTVRAIKDNCSVPMSTGATVTTLQAPIKFPVSMTSNTYCGAPVKITLSNSETGCFYRLMKGSYSVGDAGGSTGSPIEWQVNEPGSYTIEAKRTSCSYSTLMNDNPLTVTGGAKPPKPYAESVTIPYGSSTNLEALGLSENNYNWYQNSRLLLSNSKEYSTERLMYRTDFEVSEFVNYDGVICESEKQLVTVFINKPPIVDLGPDLTLYRPQELTIIANVQDPEGDNIAYSWTQISGSEVTFTGQNTPTITIPEQENEVIEFSVTVTDYFGSIASDRIKITFVQNNYNYIVESNVAVSNITNASEIDALPIGRKNVSTTYYDGLGRAMQVVQTAFSMNSNDLVQPVVYDKIGRENKKYLPFESDKDNGFYISDPVGKENSTDELDLYESSAQFLFYQRGKELIKDRYPYSEMRFDNSPLDRVIEQGAPGKSWQLGGSTIELLYRTNTSDEAFQWEYSHAEDGSFGDIKYLKTYNASELYVSETSDEHNNKVCEYKTKQGNIVLKKVEGSEDLKTYYVYDDFGNLRCVIPPQGFSELPEEITPDYVLSEEFLKKWCFIYNYDHRHRMIEKQVPGAGKVIMAYDLRDRLVISQDAIQAGKKEWTYTKYDAIDRPIVSGVYVKDVSIETLRNNINTHLIFSENSNTTTGDYTLDQSFPIDVDPSKILSVTYYDNYDFVGQSYFDSENLNYAFLPNELVKTEDNYPYSKGLVTGTKTKVLGKDKWLNSVSYYDSKNRVIQTISENYVGGQDIISNQYDFVGKILKTRQEHTGIKPLTIYQEFKYDHVGRLKEQWQQIGDDQSKKVLLAENKYNELGQLVDKGIGVKVTFEGNQEVSRVPLQSIDYRYNIRGWLTNINRSDLKTDNGETNDDTNDKFGMEMLYENIESLLPRR